MRQARSGLPHARPVWGLWWREAFLFNVDPSSGTARNLAGNPNVGVHLESAERVVIVDKVAAPTSEVDDDLVAVWQAKYPGTVKEASALAGRIVYRVLPRVVRAWTLDGFPDTVTRWRLETEMAG